MDAEEEDRVLGAEEGTVVVGRQIPVGLNIRISRSSDLVLDESVQITRLPEQTSGDHQKFSICHTFLEPPASAMASIWPLGDGIAAQTSGLLDLRRTEALPSGVTLSNALSRSKSCQRQGVSVHLQTNSSPSIPPNHSQPDHASCPSMLSGSGSCPHRNQKRQSLVPNHQGTGSNCSGDRTCGAPSLFPLLTSNRNVSHVGPLAMAVQADPRWQARTLRDCRCDGLSEPSEEFRPVLEWRKWTKECQRQRT